MAATPMSTMSDDADNDGLCDSSDLAGDNNNAGIDDARDFSPADGQPDFPDGTITVGGVLFDLCTDFDLDDDNDGYSDADEIICGSNPNPGLGSAPTDIDDDGLSTPARTSALIKTTITTASLTQMRTRRALIRMIGECGDSDGDNCDDCSAPLRTTSRLVTTPRPRLQRCDPRDQRWP